MPDTLEAVLVLFVVVLPGALHTWAAEREAGRWGIGLSDRVLRFVGASVVYQMALAAPTYLAWKDHLHRRIVSNGATAYSSSLTDGTTPSWVWLLALAYVMVPIAGGTIAGVSIHRWPRLSRILVGRDPAPRAWDFLFAGRPQGVLRARLKSNDRWVGGWFGERSYAAGYPEQPQDLLVERTYRLLEDGSFAEGEADGGYDEIGSSLLIRWEEIVELEFFPSQRGV
ncbi:MAG: DUF6338 family protein [Actinomycetota bacterium]